MFYPWKPLLLLCIVAPTAVQIQLHTKQYVWSALTFIALLANVGVFLLCGSLRIAIGGCNHRTATGDSLLASAGAGDLLSS